MVWSRIDHCSEVGEPPPPNHQPQVRRARNRGFCFYKNRGKGIAKKLVLEAIKRLSKTGSEELFAWAYSKEGTTLVKSLEKDLSRKIHTRNNS